MIILATISMLAYRSNLTHIETIVDTNNLKISYITQMRTFGRERTLSLQKMIIYNDYFQRDDEWLRFKEHAGKFIENRLKFIKMQLSDKERESINKLSKLSSKITGIQNQIATYALEDDNDKARHLLINKAIPIQDEVFRHMSYILKTIEDNTKQAVLIAENEFQTTVLNVIALATLIIFIAILITRFLILRITSAENQLFREKERAQITLYSIGDGAITTDSKGNIEHINNMASTVTGYSMKESIGKPLFEIFKLAHQKNLEYSTTLWQKVITQGEVSISESDSWLINSQGDEVAIEFSLAPIFNAEKAISGAILIFKDVSELRFLATQIAHQAQHDELTGLLNRREFENKLSEALAEVRRSPDLGYWLAYIDLDQFKVVNDTCGHLAGDELLKQLSADIQQVIREVDYFSRLGGDEFTIILKDCRYELANNIIERVRKGISDFRFYWEDKCFSVSASIGLIEITNDAGNMYDLMSKVDAACYLAKDEGRNRIHLVQPHDKAAIKQQGEMDWVHRIRHALDHKLFILYYQMIQPFNNEQTEFHAEILVRLLDDQGNIIPPNAFIPAAERYNLMTEIDSWVVVNTFQFITANGFSNQIVSINLSAQSLCTPEFGDFLMQAIEKHQIPPESVCFEITETAAIANLTLAKGFISRFRKIGCKFSLDDFGSGLSSFGYLKNLTVDYLKIDGSFVKNINNDKIDLAMVNAINQVGHTMGIKTIAEYVENKEIEITLKALGVDYAQGYSIAKPKSLQMLIS